MFDGIPTIDDIKVSNKKILLRLDLNSPIDPKTGEIMDERRFRSHKDTIKELVEKKAKVICLAHQGRPGEPDFTTLEKHTKLLGKTCGCKVKYVDSLVSSYAVDEIKNMKQKDVILLENTRFYSEEILKRPADAQATTILVKKLAPAADIFINDGFAVAHRSQPSVVGFPMLLPSAAGRLMESEVKTILGTLRDPQEPITFVLGGTKADDSIKVIRRALKKSTCTVLTGGVVGNIFLAAKGYRIGEPSIEFIRGKKMIEQVDVARKLLNKYGDRIITPPDVALDEDGQREDTPVGELPTNYKISDIGKQTTKEYTKAILESKTIFMNGALGIFEETNFAHGTETIIKAIADSKGFSVIGGGHTVAAAHKLNVGKKINHISSGGGACVNLLAGYELPAIEALKNSKKKR